ncbi:hypothetical protein VNO77_19093 [Canavalia gladiata]|uniref:Uncharacterized protein n=1 Tax=Canavalia gladiata TaxID=3824 RepID=A0AAN9LQX8_CANGL
MCCGLATELAFQFKLDGPMRIPKLGSNKFTTAAASLGLAITDATLGRISLCACGKSLGEGILTKKKIPDLLDDWGLCSIH